jgi:hypothetical protein
MEKKMEGPFCICQSCPSFKNCGEKHAFCLHGKSKCINEEKGCICGGCPVQKKFGFKQGYYCLRGSHSQQM